MTVMTMNRQIEFFKSGMPYYNIITAYPVQQRNTPFLNIILLTIIRIQHIIHFQYIIISHSFFGLNCIINVLIRNLGTNVMKYLCSRNNKQYFYGRKTNYNNQ